jgi:hypothetical protein
LTKKKEPNLLVATRQKKKLKKSLCLRKALEKPPLSFPFSFFSCKGIAKELQRNCKELMLPRRSEKKRNQRRRLWQKAVGTFKAEGL